MTRGAPTAAAVAVIGDGRLWVWEIASTVFPRAVQILDWYHLCEHLWEGARTVYGEGSAETEELVESWQAMVWEGRSEAVEQHLRDLVSAGADDSKNTVRRCADYLQTHQHRLRYRLLTAARWPVGSGVVEGACKHVIALRFKRESTRWTKCGAQAVLQIAPRYAQRSLGCPLPTHAQGRLTKRTESHPFAWLFTCRCHCVRARPATTP